MDTWRGCFRGFRVFDFLPNVFELTMLAPSRKAISGHPRVLPSFLAHGGSIGRLGPAGRPGRRSAESNKWGKRFRRRGPGLVAACGGKAAPFP